MAVEAPTLMGIGAELSGFSVREKTVVVDSPPSTEPELLSEEILCQQGSFSRVRRYFRGWHSQPGGVLISDGWQGKETEVERAVIRPIRTFMVVVSSP